MNKNLKEEISKTQLKKKSKDILDFSNDVSCLSQNQLNDLDLPNNIASAIEDLKKIKSNSAKKRQLQYIGKLFRSIDLDEIYIKFEKIRNQSEITKKHFHQIEDWRDKLINSPETITEFINKFPSTDAQNLRMLIKNARSELKNNKTRKSSKSLFKILSKIMEY